MKKMWKRFVSLLLACTLLAGMLPLSASAAEKPEVDELKWVTQIVEELNEKLTGTVSFEEKGAIPIPGSDLYAVQYQRQYMTDAFITETIMFIVPGKGANPENCVIPDTDSTNSVWANSGAIGLYIADGVTEIGNHAFDGMSTLETVEFQDSTKLTKVGEYAFNNCDKVVGLSLDLSNVTTLGKYAFNNCERLGSGENNKGVTLSDELTTIPENAFNTCGLKNVNIPKSCTKIEKNAFAHNSLSEVEELVLPNGLVTIGESAFVVTMGSGETGIGITSLTIPSSVESIGANAFSGRRNLAEVTVEDDNVPNTELELGNAAFGFNESSAFSEWGSITDDRTGQKYEGTMGTKFYLPADLTEKFINGTNCYTGDIEPMKWVKTQQPTCDTDGYHLYETTKKGAYDDEGKPLVLQYKYTIPMLGHDLDGGTPVLASCETGSYTLYKCQRENCSYTESQNIQDDATDHKYTIQSVSNLAMGNGTETVFTWECQQDGHSQERDGKPGDVSITVNPPAISADTTMTVGDLKMPEVDGGTLTLEASENPDEELTTDVTSVKVVFTPDNVKYAGYTGMGAVSGFGGVELTLKVDVNKAELDFSDVNFGNTRVFVDSTASEGTPITVYRGSLPEDVTYGPPLYSNDTGHNENTPPPRNSTWSGTVSVTFIYDPDKYEVDAEKKPGVDYTFDAGTPGQVTITHSYVIVEQSMDDLAAAPISPLTYKANTPQDTVLLSGVPYSSTVSWTWEEVGNQSNNGQGTETSPSDRNAMDIAPITGAGTYRVTITVEKDGFTSKTLDPITVTIAKATVTTPTAASDLQYTGKVQTGLQDPAPDALYKYVEGSQLTGTNAGPYTATAQLNDSENYRWSTGDDNGDGKVQISWNIAKRRVIETSIGTNYKSVPYIGNAYTAVGEPPRPSGLFTVTYREDGTLVGTLKETHAEAFTITNAQQTNAGTYEVIATITDFDNFYWQNHSEVKSYSLGTWTINRQQINAPTITAENATYTGEAYAGKVTLEHSEASDSRGSSQDIIDLDDTNIRYYTQPTGGNSGNAPVNAGTYYAGVESDGWAFVDGKVKTNYRIIGGSRAQFSISKATAKMTFGNPTETKTYTAQGTPLQKVTVSGLQGDDAEKNPTEIYSVTYTYMYRADDESEWENEERKITNPDTFVFTDVGQYRITAKWGAGTVSNNYTAADATYTLTITQAETQDITLTPDKLERWTAAEGQTPAKYTITYGEAATFAVTGKAALDTENATISYEVNGDSEVVRVDSGNGTVTIEQAGTATITVKAADTANVAGTSVDYTVTVDKATPTVSLTGDKLEVSYTGQPITGYDIAEPTANVVEGAAKPTGDITYTFYTDLGCSDENKVTNGGGKDGNIPIAVGTYYMKATYPGDTNYESAVSERVTVTVTEAQLTVDAKGYADTYDGDEHDPASITVTGVGGVISSGYTISYAKKTDGQTDAPDADSNEWKPDTQVKDVADSGDYWFKVVINEGDSYAPYIGSVTVDIDPKPLTVTKTVIPTKVYDGTVDATKNVTFQSINTGIVGETVEADRVSAVYDSPNANVDNFITITYQLTAGDNTTLANYSLDGEAVTGAEMSEKVTEVNDTPVGITPASITVAINDQKKVYDGSAPTVSNVKDTDWKVTYGKIYQLVSGTDDNLGIALSVAPDSKNAGTYAITGKWTNKNYDVTFTGNWQGEGENKDHAGTYTIDHRPISVQIGNAEGFYGDAPVLKGVELTYEGTDEENHRGLAPDENSVPNITLGTGASAQSPVAGYVIYAVDGSNGQIQKDTPVVIGNYKVTFTQNGTYTVKQRPITITIEDHSSVYGEEIDGGITTPLSGTDYTVAITEGNTVTTDGAIVNGDDLGITLFTTAKKGSDAGTYPISGKVTNTDLAKNYAITWKGENPYQENAQQATYTVGKADLAVEFTNEEVTVSMGGTVNNPLKFINQSNSDEELGGQPQDVTVKYSSNDQGVATVNETTGEITLVGTGNATITAEVTSGGKNFTEGAKDSYIIHVAEDGGLLVTVTPKTLTYTGEMQNLISYSTAPAGAEVTFKVEAQTEGDRCQIASDDGLPQGQDAGTYRVSWVAKLQGYRDATGSTTVTIAKASPTTGFSKETVSVPYEENGTFDSTEETTLNVADDYNGTITYMSNDTRVASVQGNSLENISLNGTGSATITAVFTETDNYTAATASFRITVGTAETTISYTAEDYSVEYDRTAHGSKITVNSPSEYTIMYSDNNGTSYDLNESPTITDAGDLTIYFQIQADGYNSASGTQKVTVEPKEITANMIAGIAGSYTYTGKEITFDDAISLHDEGVLLKQDTDYTIDYGDNKEVGTGSVIIKGTGNYTGSVTKEFEITPVDASDLTASLNRTFGYYDDSETNNATVTVTHGSHEVTSDGSNTVSVAVTQFNGAAANNEATVSGQTVTFNQVGTYTIEVTVMGNHATNAPIQLTYALLPVEKGELVLEADNETSVVATYGEPVNGDITVTDANGTSMTENIDYSLTYTYTPFEGTAQGSKPYDPSVMSGTPAAGMYVVTATGRGGYANSVGTFTFLILQRDLAEADLTVEDSGLVYNQNAQTPSFTVAVTGNPTADDYEVAYYNNVNASDDGAKAVVTATGNNFTGSNTENFSIAPKKITAEMVKEIPEQYYTGSAVIPPVTITDGEYTLILGYDYTTACDAIGPGTATVTIEGKGNYTGTTTKDFVIKSEGAPEPSERFDLAVRPSQWTWGDDLKDLALNVTFGTGNELDLGTEYTLEVNGQTFNGTTGKTKDDALAYIKSLKPGEYTITATGVGAYNGSTDTETVTIQKIQPEVTVTATPNSLSGGGKVTLTLKGEKLPAFAEGQDLSSLLTASAKDEKNAPDLSELEWETDEQTGVMTAELTLPNTSETYTFTLTFTGNEYYEAATASEQVVVAQQIISGGGGGPVEDQPANPDDTGVSDWLNTKEHLAYLAGYPGGIFGPDQNMTRAEAAQMFYNLLLEKDVEITVEFEDVPADAWYAKPVNTLASLGILSGVGNGRFDPERSITRAEFTVIAMKFANTSGGGVNIFSDVNEDDWFYSAVVDSTQYGWINGYPDGTFRPEATISRAEVTVIVNHMLGRAADRPYVIAHEEELNTFGDVNRGHWGYFHIAEATNAHEYHTEDGTESWTGLS